MDKNYVVKSSVILTDQWHQKTSNLTEFAQWLNELHNRTCQIKVSPDNVTNYTRVTEDNATCNVEDEIANPKTGSGLAVTIAFGQRNRTTYERILIGRTAFNEMLRRIGADCKLLREDRTEQTLELLQDKLVDETFCFTSRYDKESRSCKAFALTNRYVSLPYTIIGMISQINHELDEQHLQFVIGEISNKMISLVFRTAGSETEHYSSGVMIVASDVEAVSFNAFPIILSNKTSAYCIVGEGEKIGRNVRTAEAIYENQYDAIMRATRSNYVKSFEGKATSLCPPISLETIKKHFMAKNHVVWSIKSFRKWTKRRAVNMDRETLFSDIFELFAGIQPSDVTSSYDPVTYLRFKEAVGKYLMS